MDNFYQEILTLLINPPGNLTYYLVLTFSVIGALLIAVNRWRDSRSVGDRRMILGLGLLLVLRLTLFLLAGIAWQGLINDHLLIAPLDRAITSLSLVLIIWLWAFPEPSRLADAATLLVGFLVLILGLLNAVWWSNTGAELPYNTSTSDTPGVIFNLVLISIGSLLLLARKPDGWSFGFAMLALLLVGDLLYLLLPQPEADFSGVIRLFEMSAYPMLLILPQRSPLALRIRQTSDRTRESRRDPLDAGLLEDFLALSTAGKPDRLCRVITRTISNAILAEMCLLATAPNENGEILIECGFDLIRENHLDGFRLSIDQVPNLARALRYGSALLMKADHDAPDQVSLGQKLELERCGSLLATPIQSEQGETLFGIILLSPHSNRDWTEADQALLTKFSVPLAQLLQRTYQQNLLREELEQAQQALQNNLEETDRLRQEYQSLQDQLNMLQEYNDNNRYQAESLAALIAAQEIAREVHADQETVPAQFADQMTTELTVNQIELDEHNQYLEAELRLALEELARLKASLSEADQKVLEMQRNLSSDAPLTEQSNQISALTRELRQPMSSILGYTDFLLSESVGILGALQRKYLERIKIATERLNRLVEELFNLAGSSTAQQRLNSDMVDVNELVDGAVTHITEQLRQKEIALRVDLPIDFPAINLDRNVLEKILVTLLENAGGATPTGGDIQLRARLQQDDAERTYALFQISDHGGGINPEDIPRIFVRHSHSNGTPLAGIGVDTIDLSIVKSMVDNLDGRIWIDSQPQSGATFSILLPIPRTFSSRESGGAQL